MTLEQVQIRGDFGEMSPRRQSSKLAAFLSLMDLTRDKITIHRIDKKEALFDLGVPAEAVERLRQQLISQGGRLRLLGAEQVILTRATGEIEEWVVEKSKFVLAGSINVQELNGGDLESGPNFEPVSGIWRFHMIYLVVTGMLIYAVFPYQLFISLLIVAGISISGLIFALQQYTLPAHLLAVAIGLGTPIVVCARLPWGYTLIFFSLLTFGLYAVRKFLF